MLTIVETADGSNTVFNSEIGENYHSRNGALQESRHVFIKMGLEYFLKETSYHGFDKQTVSVLEVGFGTGLNFLLSADHCLKNGIALSYTGIEAYPVSPELLAETGYRQYVSNTLWAEFLEQYGLALDGLVTIGNNCRLKIPCCCLTDFDSDERFDIVYYDAFAAARQPEMWDAEAISHTIRFLKPGGVFVTYAITGNLKRTLTALGCNIWKLPGALGKREMLRATRVLPG